MYINKPLATKIEAADRVNLLHSTIVKFVLFLDFEVIEGSRGCSKKMQCALRL